MTEVAISIGGSNILCLQVDDDEVSCVIYKVAWPQFISTDVFYIMGKEMAEQVAEFEHDGSGTVSEILVY